MKPPKDLKDHRTEEAILFDARTAEKYSDPGTVLHFALRLGYFPNTEEEAEAILKHIILEKEYYEMCIALHENEVNDFKKRQADYKENLPKFHLDSCDLEV